MVSDSPCLQGTDGVNLCDAHNGSEGLQSSAAAFPHLRTPGQWNGCKQKQTIHVNRSAAPVKIQSFHKKKKNQRMTHLSIATHNNLFASKHYICGPLQAGRDKQNDTYRKLFTLWNKAAVACLQAMASCPDD